MIGDGWRWLEMLDSVSWAPLGGADAARTREIETLVDPGRPLACLRIPKRAPKSAPKGSPKGSQKGPPWRAPKSTYFLSRCQNASLQWVWEAFFFVCQFGGSPGGAFGPLLGLSRVTLWVPRGFHFGTQRPPLEGPKRSPKGHPLGTLQNGKQKERFPNVLYISVWAPK